MEKALLVIDMPEYCAECPCCDECVEMCRAIDKEIIEVNGECQKPDWCPLVEVPQKKDIKNANTMTDLGWIEGFNAFLGYILKKES